MILVWFCIAMISLATLTVLLRPLLTSISDDPRSGDIRLVYEDQLADLERDVARGVVSENEAEALRTEIARRLLAADKLEDNGAYQTLSRQLRRAAAIVIALLVVGASALLYSLLGNPGLPGVPASDRAEEREYIQNIEKLANLMKKNPEDPTGWRLLAVGYRATGRLEEAAQAYENAVTLGKQEASVLADYGEILVLLNKGQITDRAREVFDQAVAQSPEDERSRYYQALGWMQSGEFEKARTGFQSLQQSAPEDAPWRQNVDRRLKEIDVLEAQEGGDTPDRVQDNPQILAMVQGLAARLEEEPKDLEGWLRLMRSYVVLEEQELAAEAYKTAIDTFAGDAEAIKQLQSIADDLKLLPLD